MMNQKMNEQVVFISCEQFLVVKIMPNSNVFKVVEGSYMKIPLASKQITEFMKVICSDRSTVLLGDMIVIEKDNEVLSLSLLMDNGKAYQQKRILMGSDIKALIYMLTNGEQRKW